MKSWIALTLLIFAGISLADAPSTRPAAKAEGTVDTLPTPGELIRRLKEREAKQALKPKVAFFDLSRPVEEKPPEFSLFGDDGALTLRSLVQRLHAARDDKDIRGVLLTIGADSGMNLAQAQEVRDALSELRRAGKPSFVYADGYDTDAYTLASGATDICLLEGGEIMMPGVGLEATFAKGFLDKVGVQADYVQIGEYKGADEEYTRTGASDELRGELNKLTDALYNQIIDGISFHRNLPRSTVVQAIDEAILTAPVAKERGLVDHLVDQDGLRPLLAKELGSEVDLVYEYGRTAKEAPDLSNPFALFSLLTKKTPTPDGPAVALVFAEGVIVDGEGGDGMFSESGVGSEAIRKAIRIAARDENIKAIVIRIDSPGGSALASEVMWQCVRHLAGKKPVIISIGSMAASGGYYLASAGDHIFADPSAIVGSIGVVGGKFVLKGLYEKLGLNTEAFSKGTNAGLFSSNEPFSDRQRKMVTNWMRQTYDQFTERVMTTRKGKIKDIDEVARGRIFLAKQARSLGLVDEIGGVEDALAYAAKGAGLEAGKYEVRVLPAPRTLADIFSGSSPDAAFAFKPKVQLSSDSILKALPAATRKVLAQQLQTLQLLQERPVILASPFIVTVR